MLRKPCSPGVYSRDRKASSHSRDNSVCTTGEISQPSTEPNQGTARSRRVARMNPFQSVPHELQANVFARELLLPRTLARKLAQEGMGPAKIADDLGIPLEFVRLQMLDALLLPDAEATIGELEPPSPDQLAAAKAAEHAA